MQGHLRTSKGIQGHLWASMVNLSNIAKVHRNRDLAIFVWRSKEKGSEGGHQQQPKLVGVD